MKKNPSKPNQQSTLQLDSSVDKVKNRRFASQLRNSTNFKTENNNGLQSPFDQRKLVGRPKEQLLFDHMEESSEIHDDTLYSKAFLGYSKPFS